MERLRERLAGDVGDLIADMPEGVDATTIPAGPRPLLRASQTTCLCAQVRDGLHDHERATVNGQWDLPRGQFTHISAGGFHNCALRTGGSAVCWGNNDTGQSSVPTR